jgi:hypothetical protein
MTSFWCVCISLNQEINKYANWTRRIKYDQQSMMCLTTSESVWYSCHIFAISRYFYTNSSTTFSPNTDIYYRRKLDLLPVSLPKILQKMLVTIIFIMINDTKHSQPGKTLVLNEYSVSGPGKTMTVLFKVIAFRDARDKVRRLFFGRCYLSAIHGSMYVFKCFTREPTSLNKQCTKTIYWGEIFEIMQCWSTLGQNGVEISAQFLL